MAISYFIPKNSDIKLEENLDHDEYFAYPADLIALGIITPDMLPGQPGRNKTTVTINGRKGRAPGPDYLQIRHVGKRVRVKVGLSQEERARRLAADRAEQAEIREQLRKFDHAIEMARQLRQMERQRKEMEDRAAAGEPFAAAWIKRDDIEIEQAKQIARGIMQGFNDSL